MNIIRDEDFTGILMIPLFQQYGLNRCNVRDCKEKHTTIVTGLIKTPFALCENHYQECKISGQINYTLDFK